LVTFLESGDPPRLITLGAMSLGADDAYENASLFVEAVRRAGVRAIIQGWDAGIRRLALPPTIYAAGSLPHTWLLPRCAGIVHHGGFGTTSAGLRAGIPSLIIPHLVDQFYWGRRVHELGVGLKPIQRAKLDAEALAVALQGLTRSADRRAAAARLGEQIRAEDGVANAVRLIEETFG
jgi:UDP:flavonoid glycosyltransferase YjiC (YdhE family)